MSQLFPFYLTQCCRWLAGTKHGVRALFGDVTVVWYNRVGQSREIYSNSVPLSPPHWPYSKRIRPPSWSRVAVASSIQNTKLFTWRTWPGAGAVPKCDWAQRRGASVDPNSGAPFTQSTFNMLRRMANPLSLLNWWLHKYDNEDDYALFQM